MLLKPQWKYLIPNNPLNQLLSPDLASETVIALSALVERVAVIDVEPLRSEILVLPAESVSVEVSFSLIVTVWETVPPKDALPAVTPEIAKVTSSSSS